MSTKLKVYTNEDDALLFWSVPAPIPRCRGFAVERRMTEPSGRETETFLPNRMGFEAEPEPARAEEGQQAVTRPSTEWPFQRFSWTDHAANTGDAVSYRVIPVVRTATTAATLERLDSHASEWSPTKTLGAAGRSRFRPFFNRGFVMSQFMARYLAERNLTLDQFKRTIRDKDDRTIRHFLSGDLRVALLGELKQALDEGGHIFAALFELNDAELINALGALRKRAHVVLANGSASASQKNDENFIIVRGDPELAEAYAVNILGAYAHYRWRAFLSQTDRPFNGLKDHDRWQGPMLAANRRDLRFWGV